jgi:hypothetical protein
MPGHHHSPAFVSWLERQSETSHLPSSQIHNGFMGVSEPHQAKKRDEQDLADDRKTIDDEGN